MLISFKIFLSLKDKALPFSLIETKKINKLKRTIKICKLMLTRSRYLPKKDNAIIKKDDLKKTVYLKTAIIEKE